MGSRSARGPACRDPRTGNQGFLGRFQASRPIEMISGEPGSKGGAGPVAKLSVDHGAGCHDDLPRERSLRETTPGIGRLSASGVYYFIGCFMRGDFVRLAKDDVVPGLDRAQFKLL